MCPEGHWFPNRTYTDEVTKLPCGCPETCEEARRDAGLPPLAEMCPDCKERPVDQPSVWNRCDKCESKRMSI